MSNIKSRIGLIENDVLFCHRMVTLLKNVPSLKTAEINIWQSSEIFWHDDGARNLDLIFLDIMLPNMSGVDLAAHLSVRDPATPIVMLTNMNSDELIFQSLTNGAVGYILKSELDDMAHVVETVLRGGAIITPTIAFRVLGSFKKKENHNKESTLLTFREREILDHLVCGRAVNKVALLLDISNHTVQTHVKKIYKKLNVHSRVELVSRSLEMKHVAGVPDALIALDQNAPLTSTGALKVVKYFQGNLSNDEDNSTERELTGKQEKLTLREQDVLRMLQTGMDNKKIASQMQVSESTVKFHIKNIYRKLNVNNRIDLLKSASRHI